jgi:hypothetical protein
VTQRLSSQRLKNSTSAASISTTRSWQSSVHGNKVDYTALSVSGAASTGVDLVDREYTPTVMTEDMPESPSVQKLVRFQEELKSKASDQNLETTKKFEHPRSSGEAQAHPGFMFQQYNMGMNPHGVHPARSPILQPSTVSQKGHIAQDVINGQYQLRYKQLR